MPPQIVGEYHLPPDNDFIWCCHCQGHHHRNGFVITNATGKHYLLGSECGPKHYDLSFKLARREHIAKVKRRGVLERLQAIVAAAPAMNVTIQEILHSEGLRILDAKREELRKASGDAFSALATSVATGMPLYEIVTVRDRAAEQRRDEQRPEEKDGSPTLGFSYAYGPAIAGRAQEGPNAIVTASNVNFYFAWPSSSGGPPWNTHLKNIEFKMEVRLQQIEVPNDQGEIRQALEIRPIRLRVSKTEIQKVRDHLAQNGEDEKVQDLFFALMNYIALSVGPNLAQVIHFPILQVSDFEVLPMLFKVQPAAVTLGAR